MRKKPLIKTKEFYSIFTNEDIKGLSRLIKSTDVNAFNEERCNPLILAAQHGKLKLTRYLLKKGANPNVEDDSGMSPLYNASASGNLQIVKELIKKKANINYSKKRNPLIIAACYNRLSIVQYLLKKKAIITKNKNGRTARFFAAMYNHKKIVKLLESHGSNEKLIDSHGFTPQEAFANDMKD